MDIWKRIGGADEGGSDAHWSIWVIRRKELLKMRWFGWKYAVLCPYEAKLISCTGKDASPSADARWDTASSFSEQIPEILRKNPRITHLTNALDQNICKVTSCEMKDACRVSLSVNRVQCICRLGMEAGLLQFNTELRASIRVPRGQISEEHWPSDRDSLCSFHWHRSSFCVSVQ